MRLWYVNEVVRPAAAACIVVLAARLILPPPMNHVLLVGYLACVFSGAMLITAYVMPETRSMLQGQMARLRHALT